MKNALRLNRSIFLFHIRRVGLSLITLPCIFCTVTLAHANPTGLVATYERALEFQRTQKQNPEPQVLLYQVSKRYFDATLSQSRLNSLKSHISEIKELLQLANQRRKRGTARRSDLLLCRITFANTQVQILDTKQELEQKRSALEDLTGTLSTQLKTLSHITNPDIPSIDQVDEYLRHSLENNSDYLKLKKALPATQHDLALMQRRITQRLRLSILGARAARYKIRALDLAAKESVQYLEIAKEGYMAGLSIPMAIIDASERFEKIKHMRYQTMVDLVMHLLKLDKLAGKLDKSKLVLIEKWMSKKSLSPD